MLPDSLKKGMTTPCWMTVKMEKGGGGTYSPANQPEMHSYNPANQLAIIFTANQLLNVFLITN
jgi:hypothetical protein